MLTIIALAASGLSLIVSFARLSNRRSPAQIVIDDLNSNIQRCQKYNGPQSGNSEIAERLETLKTAKHWLLKAIF